MKLIALNWKYLKYSVWFGIALISAGVTAGAVANRWGVLPIALIAVGVAIVLAWLAMSGQSIRSFWGQRSTQAGTNALVATLAMLVILGLVNFLGVRYTKRVDLTENQLFTLSPQTVEVVEGLEQPVKVWVFDRSPSPQDRQLLEDYRRRNGDFSYEYVDPQAQPVVAERFEVQSFGEVYLESGTRRRFVQVVNAEQRLSERSLTNALAQIRVDRQLKVYFMQGHGEKSLEGGQQGLSQAVAQLGEESYAAEPLNLAQTGRVPDDASVLVVAGAQRPLLEAEVRALEDYLTRQSGLMLLVDPLTETGLEPLLEDWGVTLSNQIILDPAGQAAGYGPTTVLITQYGDHPITRDLSNGYSLYPIAQPLGIDDEPDITEAPLMFTSDQTQAQEVTPEGSLEFDPNGETGSLTIGVALSRAIDTDADADAENAAPPADPDEATDEAVGPEARMVVIGNSSFVADALSNLQLNSDVFLNSVNWLSQQNDQSLSIRPKEMTNRRILLSGAQQIWLGAGALVLLPLFGFAAAFFAWWRRR